MGSKSVNIKFFSDALKVNKTIKELELRSNLLPKNCKNMEYFCDALR